MYRAGLQLAQREKGCNLRFLDRRDESHPVSVALVAVTIVIGFGLGQTITSNTFMSGSMFVSAPVTRHVIANNLSVSQGPAIGTQSNYTVEEDAFDEHVAIAQQHPSHQPRGGGGGTQMDIVPPTRVLRRRAASPSRRRIAAAATAT